jgi:hypothetical protein
LYGILGEYQLSAVREKLEMLVCGPGVFFFVNLQNARFTTEAYRGLFLEMLNLVKQQNATLILLFDNDELNAYFERYKNIFEIYKNREEYRKSGLSKQVHLVGLHYEKKSISLSLGFAISLALFLIGWTITLFTVIVGQGREISDKQAQITALESQKARYIREIDRLESAIGPMRKLGVVQDTTLLSSFGAIQDWVTYLENLERNRREK